MNEFVKDDKIVKARNSLSQLWALSRKPVSDENKEEAFILLRNIRNSLLRLEESEEVKELKNKAKIFFERIN